MKADPVVIAAVGVIFLFLFLAATHLRFALEDPRITPQSPPLHKNAQLQLMDGEVYRYNYTSAEYTMELIYEVHDGPGCTMITIPDAGTSICLDSWGERVAGPDAVVGDPTVLLFKPWMLALNDSWRWSSSVYLSFNNSLPEHICDISYRVIRREMYMGRDAFVVEVKADASEPEYEWVDSEKRITLRILGEGYEVVLENLSG